MIICSRLLLILVVLIENLDEFISVWNLALSRLKLP